MIGNVIDRRKYQYRWMKVEAIFEPTWHDNSCKDSDQADVGENEGIGYSERGEISVSDALTTAHDLPYVVTVYFYDVGTNIEKR